MTVLFAAGNGGCSFSSSLTSIFVSTFSSLLSSISKKMFSSSVSTILSGGVGGGKGGERGKFGGLLGDEVRETNTSDGVLSIGEGRGDARRHVDHAAASRVALRVRGAKLAHVVAPPRYVCACA